MGKTNVLEMIYKKMHTADDISFDDMQGPSVYNLLSPQDIYQLNKIATSVKLAGNLKKKLAMIDSIMKSRGFRKFAGGTNRIVYTSYEIPNIVVKVAIDKVGMRDNPAEMLNQNFLKPFVAKMFSVSEDGVVAVCEKIVPITTLEEFGSLSEMIFEIIVKKILREYIIDDIGIKYFLNWGYRYNGFPCLLDYPYLYKLDPTKLHCKKQNGLTNYMICNGEIDYDEGFNHLVCKKCGSIYRAADIGFNLVTELDKYIISNKGDKIMKVSMYMKDGRVLSPVTESEFIQKPEKEVSKKNKVTISDIDSLVYIGSEDNSFELKKEKKSNDNITKASTSQIVNKIEEEVEDHSITDKEDAVKESLKVNNDNSDNSYTDVESAVEEVKEEVEDHSITDKEDAVKESLKVNNNAYAENNGFYIDAAGRLRDERGRYAKNKKEKKEEHKYKDEVEYEDDFIKKTGKKKYKSFNRKDSIRNIDQF